MSGSDSEDMDANSCYGTKSEENDDYLHITMDNDNQTVSLKSSYVQLRSLFCILAASLICKGGGAILSHRTCSKCVASEGGANCHSELATSSFQVGRVKFCHDKSKSNLLQTYVLSGWPAKRQTRPPRTL
ncbi:hypothetical protein AVEN_135918-1 [Araneus ventricosus]|uniref:Uncharacterized protein n=1 Tax=Araneus ventricosus TaxID=182803 RepID=A0A4Y2N174_ARAVE|nr:hypothetical protein AVEN_135918-1 [Araneus ventricosus]